jgi:hypothetical protein
MSSSGVSSKQEKDKRVKKEADSDSSDDEPMAKKKTPVNKGGKDKGKATKKDTKKDDKKKDTKRKKKDESDSDEEANARPRKVGTARRTEVKVKENDDGDSYIAIDDNRRLTVKMYKGKLQVDVREVRCFSLSAFIVLTDLSPPLSSFPPPPASSTTPPRAP